MAMQGSQTPQGSVVGPPLPSLPTQFSPLATILAVVVLPVPRMPVRIKAWAIRSASNAFFQRTHHCILTDQIGEGRGAVFARQYLIGLGRFAHVFPRIRATLAG